MLYVIHIVKCSLVENPVCHRLYNTHQALIKEKMNTRPEMILMLFHLQE